MELCFPRESSPRRACLSSPTHMMTSLQGDYLCLWWRLTTFWARITLPFGLMEVFKWLSGALLSCQYTGPVFLGFMAFWPLQQTASQKRGWVVPQDEKMRREPSRLIKKIGEVYYVLLLIRGRGWLEMGEIWSFESQNYYDRNRTV